MPTVVALPDIRICWMFVRLCFFNFEKTVYENSKIGKFHKFAILLTTNHMFLWWRANRDDIRFIQHQNYKFIILERKENWNNYKFAILRSTKLTCCSDEGRTEASVRRTKTTNLSKTQLHRPCFVSSLNNFSPAIGSYFGVVVVLVCCFFKQNQLHC